MSPRRVAAVVAFCVIGAAVFGVTIVAGAVGLVTGDLAPAQSGGQAAPSPGPPIPGPMLTLYAQAAATCPGLPPSVLAAIGAVESSHGTSDLPGVHSGANPAGAEGSMQFLPATFAAYALPVPPGGADPPSPYDAVDAVYAAARLLCTNGAAGGADLAGAVYAYNHSGDYVTEVMVLAAQYAGAFPTGLGTGP